ncbi:hypothetical protein FIBSPDRAFT_984530 [Athelia psychrophila]|uniref:Uncharacterized protein n=1 Tax=Athelia psychrophila TaxID=1759441 RepID=A0A166BKK5_9AGAM|nr:hypothetical protein FIBSPDRAFT_984530 [Fibularhizoctonia sp. CBS 109695]
MPAPDDAVLYVSTLAASGAPKAFRLIPKQNSFSADETARSSFQNAPARCEPAGAGNSKYANRQLSHMHESLIHANIVEKARPGSREKQPPRLQFTPPYQRWRGSQQDKLREVRGAAYSENMQYPSLQQCHVELRASGLILGGAWGCSERLIGYVHSGGCRGIAASRSR